MRNLFPRWVNTIPVKVILSLGIIGGTVTAGITYYATPKYTRVGYQPTQPVSYDHSFHAGQLGLDCRYCHHGVDKSSHANIPSANVCMSCHKNIKADSPLLAPIRDSYFGEDENKDGKLSEGEDLNDDGISGKAGSGRYGWKADVINLEEQTGQALSLDLGISSELFPNPFGDCTQLQHYCLSRPNGASRQDQNLEIGPPAFASLLFFIRNIPFIIPIYLISSSFNDYTFFYI